MIEKLYLETKERICLIDITSSIENIVKKSKIKEGFVLIFVPHATASIIINENEQGLINDYKKWLTDTFFKDNWEHNKIDNNAGAHLASAFIGNSRILPIKNGELVKGTWQNILFLELDGPRSNREVIVQIINAPAEI